MNKNWRMMICICLVGILSVNLSGCQWWKHSTETSAKDTVPAEVYMSEKDESDTGYELARQLNQLEDDWQKFTIQLNDLVVTLPCSASSLESIGLKMDTSFMADDVIVNRGNRESVYYKNGQGDAIFVTFMNPDRTPRALKDCLVTGIAVTEYDLQGGDLTVTFPGGVQMHSEKSTALIAYGHTYEVYESDAVQMYTWHDKNSYYKSCEIDYDTKTHRTTAMFLNY